MFWIILFPRHKQKTLDLIIKNIMLHLLPLLLLWIEMILSSIKIRKSSYKPLIALSLAYFILILIISVFIHPVYGNIKFNDVKSYLYCIIALVLIMGHNYIGIVYCNKFKKNH